MLFTYLWESIKDVEDTEEALKKKKSHTSKHEILSLFTFLWVIFALLGRDSESGGTADQEPDLVDQNRCGSIRFRIQLPICNTGKKL
jgi:hypothetical protein